MTRIKPQGTLRQKAPVIKDPAYMEWMKQLCQVHGCVLCKAPAERAHVRMGEVCEICEGGGEVAALVDTPMGAFPCPYLGEPCMDCKGTGHRFGKLPTGMSERDDPWTIPLCPEHHRTGPHAQHTMPEILFWRGQGIDVLKICHELQQAYPSIEAGVAVLERAKES